jgi:hypothetical protein
LFGCKILIVPIYFDSIQFSILGMDFYQNTLSSTA